MIALLLSASDLKNLMVSCKAGHVAGAPVLYRSVEAWLDPIDFGRLQYEMENQPVSFLLTLVNSTLPHATLCLPSRFYAAHLVTFCYGSWSLACDYRAMPLLAEALRFTYRLQHLRLDISGESVPTLLDVFRRSSIIVTPSTLLPGSRPVDRHTLPCLRSVRTTRIAVADALMQHRVLHTVIVDMSIKWEVLAKFLRAAPPWDPTHLQRLSLYVDDHPPTDGMVEGMLNAFPRLEHLAIRVTAARTPRLLKDALRVLTELPVLGQSLRALSINHGSYFANYGVVLEDQRSIFAEGISMRPALREVVMGSSMWSRQTVFHAWSFSEFEDSFMGHWAWLEHRSEGQWAMSRDAVRAYHQFG
uniref:N/A n=1 Tax=Ganoderma boninense TaxID=34458 RepID=A0A5K1JZV6_9APHY|nr:N/A [Ganoderma boninense]